MLPDDPHSNAEDYKVMNRNFAQKVAGKLFVKAQQLKSVPGRIRTA